MLFGSESSSKKTYGPEGLNGGPYPAAANPAGANQLREKKRTNAGTSTWAYYVDGKNQLTNGTVVGLAEYDLNGNLTNRSAGPAAYTYDDENRLVAARVFYEDEFGVHGWRTDFEYDGVGRLRRRSEYLAVEGGKDESSRSPASPDGGGGGWEWYFDYSMEYTYDGWRVIQERAMGTPTVSYTRGNDLSGTFEGAAGIGGLLARSSGYSGGSWTSHAFYHADGNGNITCLISTNQSVVASYRYDPFGNTISMSGTLAEANTYRFSSKELHVQSGLYYYGYRFYDPILQRWMNGDPIGDVAFNPKRSRLLSTLQRVPMEGGDLLRVSVQNRILLGDGPNAFVAMHNSPINRIDRFGLTACTDMCDNDFLQKFHNCTCYANTAAKIGAIGGGVAGCLIGAVGGAEGGIGGVAVGCVVGGAVVGGLDAGGFYVLTKAGCRYAAFIARGACYAGCMSVEGL